MEIDGIPVHPLVVHAVVIAVPVAALLALAHVLVPRWRRGVRAPLAVSVVVAAVTAVIATVSGEELATSRGLDSLPAVQEHEDLGELLRNVVLVFAVVTGLSLWRLRGAGESPDSRAVQLALGAVTAVLAVAVLAIGVQAGHSGARSVWGA